MQMTNNTWTQPVAAVSDLQWNQKMFLIFTDSVITEADSTIIINV